MGDGYLVRRHDVPPQDNFVPGWKEALTQVKNLIAADYNVDPAPVKTVFLRGHVPVPFFGIYDRALSPGEIQVIMKGSPPDKTDHSQVQNRS